ncbi:hypothetical protein C2E23DRAFT_861575 [Lenzites betulinus]|nr:hypothetical protein C2E23DRAFT_861575 [Lenzites betulinus]
MQPGVSKHPLDIGLSEVLRSGGQKTRIRDASESELVSITLERREDLLLPDYNQAIGASIKLAILRALLWPSFDRILWIRGDAESTAQNQSDVEHQVENDNRRDITGGRAHKLRLPLTAQERSPHPQMINAVTASRSSAIQMTPTHMAKSSNQWTFSYTDRRLVRASVRATLLLASNALNFMVVVSDLCIEGLQTDRLIYILSLTKKRGVNNATNVRVHKRSEPTASRDHNIAA